MSWHSQAGPGAGSRLKSVLQRLLKPLCLVLGLGLLTWMVLQAGPRQLWDTLCSMPGTILLCVMVWGSGYLLNAASFREVLQAIHPEAAQLGFVRVLRLTVTGYAINYVTPFGLLGGEPYRVLALRPMMGTEKATRSVVLYSTMHITSHFCFWALAALVAVFVYGWGRGDSETTIAISFMGIVSLFDWRHLPPGPRYRALAYEFLGRMVNVLEYQLIMQALGYDSFGYTDAFLCVAFSSLFANVLFFSPMQMGTREGGIFLALQYLLPQLPSAELFPVALSLSFATRIREFIWIAIGMLGFRRVKY